MTAATRTPATSAQPDEGGAGRGDLARATAAVSSLNLLSRATGLVRVVAMSAALGATTLGDTFQAANIVSNILFELLAGGLLSAALVPMFVELIDSGRRAEASRLAGILLGVALAGLCVVVAVALAGAEQLMRLLTISVEDPSQRADQTELGVFLLWFFLPQVLLYAVGAVATALLHADRRFVAAAVAPVFNNLVVTAAMGIFWLMRSGQAPSLDLPLSERLVLGAGATLGVLAMTAVPVVAARRGGLGVRPRWEPRDERLRPLVARGAWAAGHLGLNQAFAMATIVAAAGVAGGVVAYQVAFTFFLLPYALLGNPLTTTLFPRLAAGAAAGRTGAMTAELRWGLRLLAFLLVPAAFLVAALARPVLALIRLGNLDESGAELVAVTTSAYMAGLLGYGAFFLLTRASYAAGDTRSPTLVSLATTITGVGGLVAVSAWTTGSERLVGLGLVHAAVVTTSAVVLLRTLRARIGRLAIGAAVLRDVVAGALAGGLAWTVGDALGVDSRWDAVGGLLAGGGAGVAVYVGIQAVVGREELRSLRRPGSVLR